MATTARERLAKKLAARLTLDEMRQLCRKHGLSHSSKNKANLAMRLAERCPSAAAKAAGITADGLRACRKPTTARHIRAKPITKESESAHQRDQPTTQNALDAWRPQAQFRDRFEYSETQQPMPSHSRPVPVLETKAQIDAALQMTHPLAAAAAIAYAEEALSGRLDSRTSEESVVTALAMACPRLNVSFSNREAMDFLSTYSADIFGIGTSIVRWVEKDHVRFERAKGWIVKGALVGVGALFGIWIS